MTPLPAFVAFYPPMHLPLRHLQLFNAQCPSGYIHMLKPIYSDLGSVGHDPKPYKKQLSELRYSGVKTDRAPSLLEVIR